MHISNFLFASFRTDIQVVAECQAYFGFNLPTVDLARRTAKFLASHNRYRPTSFSSWYIMAALRSRCGHYIFALWFLLSFFFFFSFLD